MSEIVTCPLGLTGRIRGMKFVRGELFLPRRLDLIVILDYIVDSRN